MACTIFHTKLRAPACVLPRAKRSLGLNQLNQPFSQLVLGGEGRVPRVAHQVVPACQ